MDRCEEKEYWIESGGGMSKKVPQFIATRYADGAHGFRRTKRLQALNLHHNLEMLRLGCTWFPCGEEPINIIVKQIQIIRQSITVKNWGK